MESCLPTNRDQPRDGGSPFLFAERGAGLGHPQQYSGIYVVQEIEPQVVTCKASTSPATLSITQAHFPLLSVRQGSLARLVFEELIDQTRAYF